MDSRADTFTAIANAIRADAAWQAQTPAAKVEWLATMLGYAQGDVHTLVIQCIDYLYQQRVLPADQVRLVAPPPPLHAFLAPLTARRPHSLQMVGIKGAALARRCAPAWLGVHLGYFL